MIDRVRIAKKWINNRGFVIAQHIGFWVLSFFVMLYLFKSGDQPARVDYVYTALFHLLLLPPVYINLKLFLDKLRIKYGWISYLIKLVLLIAIFSYLNYSFFQEWSVYLFPDYFFISYYTLPELAVIYFIYIAITTLIKGARSWFVLWQVQSELQEAEKQKTQMELQALKSQVNPHFLFNTLNGIYSMSLNKDERLPATVLQLSDLMRYFLYKAKGDYVPLKKEIELLHSYIALQKLRMGDDQKVNVNVTGEIDEQQIAPLLLVTFLENAFKHGDKQRSNGELLNLKIDVKGRQLYFDIRNGKGTVDDVEDNEYKGLGLQNLQRRLELQYPNSHALSIHNEQHEFHVQLQLNLNAS